MSTSLCLASAVDDGGGTRHRSVELEIHWIVVAPMTSAFLLNGDCLFDREGTARACCGVTRTRLHYALVVAGLPVDLVETSAVNVLNARCVKPRAPCDVFHRHRWADFRRRRLSSS
jgi:hypothetical protein